MPLRSKTDIQRVAPSELLSGVLSLDSRVSEDAGLSLCKNAASFGLNLRDYLRLAADPRLEKDEAVKAQLSTGNGQYLNGYEASLSLAGLPVQDDFDSGVTMQLAADSFASRKGLRGLMPEVVEDVLRWKHKQDMWSNMDGMLANRRTIDGVEMITKVTMDDDSQTHGTFSAPEFGRLPTFTLSAGEHAVKFYKVGSAIKTSYEFERRVTIDILTPYAARVEKQKQIDKLRVATAVMINGDGVHGAANTEDLKAVKWGGDWTANKTLKDNYKALVRFLASRAYAGMPIDTIAGNINTYVELLFMFAPTNVVKSEMEHLQGKGFPRVGLTLPILNDVNFKLVPAMPDNKLMAFSVDDTLEELTEAGSKISESEKSIQTQTYYYTNSENLGYRLLFDDTRVLVSF